MPVSLPLELIAGTLALLAGSPSVPGEVLVQPRAGRESAAMTALHLGGLDVREREPNSGLLRVGVPEGAEAAWMDVLNRWPWIAFTELNGIGSGGEMPVIPDDTFFELQWHLHNTGQSGGLPGADVAATQAWTITTGSARIGVAVLDTGIRFDHPEFAGRIASNGYNFVAQTNDPTADHPHGTLVSGVLGANGDNGFSVAGMDWHCTIIPIKVLNQNNQGTTFNLVRGIQYAAQQPNVHIVSMSLINYSASMSLENALITARNNGKILLACGGNGGIGNADVSWPGASMQTIAFGWTTRFDMRANSSGTGERLDFVAPGSFIATTRNDSIDDGYVVVSGCSFATPLAAGIASLLLARAQDYGVELSQDDIYDLLIAGAEDEVGPPQEDLPGWDPFFGHGRLNAYRSLLALGRWVTKCPADINQSGAVDLEDLVLLLSTWGPCPRAPEDCPADLDGSRAVGTRDLFLLLSAWGACP